MLRQESWHSMIFHDIQPPTSIVCITSTGVKHQPPFPVMFPPRWEISKTPTSAESFHILPHMYMCVYIYIEINHYRQYVKDLPATRGNPQASMITSSFVKTDQMQIFPQGDWGWLRVLLVIFPLRIWDLTNQILKSYFYQTKILEMAILTNQKFETTYNLKWVKDRWIDK